MVWVTSPFDVYLDIQQCQPAAVYLRKMPATERLSEKYTFGKHKAYYSRQSTCLNDSQQNLLVLSGWRDRCVSLDRLKQTKKKKQINNLEKFIKEEEKKMDKTGTSI